MALAEPASPAAEGARHEGCGTLASILADTLREIGAHTGAIYRLVPQRQVLELLVMEGLPREFVQPWERVSLSAPIPVADALRDRRLVWITGEEEMAHRYPAVAVALPYEFSLAALPLSVGEDDYGAMFVVWSGAYPPPSAGERDRLTAAAAVLARRLRDLPPGPATPGRDEVAAAVPDRAEMLGAMVGRLPEGICTLDARGRLTYISPKGAALLGESPLRLLGIQPWTVLTWLDDPVYEDRYRRAMISQQPTSFVALRPPDRWLSFELYPSISGVTVRITPAPADSEPQPAPRQPVDVALPTRAGAIYHVLHLAGTLTQAMSVQDVVDLLADQIVPAFGAHAVALLTAHEGRVAVLGHRGFPQHVVDQYGRLSLTAPTPSVRTMVTGVPGFFESEKELYDIYPSAVAPDDGMAAWALLPLIASGRPVGTCVIAFAEPHRFTVEERAVLTSLGGLLAQALERARLYDATLELAHGLQQGLLPHAFPDVPGLKAAARYLPGTEGMDIGGDFYDLIRLPGDTAAAVIGDVQGHNVTAAALMGQLRTAIRAYATAGADPGEVLSRTNHLLTELSSALFASCAYVHLDLPHGTARVARAGHPHPLIRRPGGRVEVLEVPDGMLLGVSPETTYTCLDVSLEPGAILALYTDGLVETPGKDIDEGLAVLSAELAAAGDRPLDELADHLIARAPAPGGHSDDIALLLLRLTGPGR
ncbi:SpoIIE family protein phosphatase [Thermoactinospora rubra]|uniref:SpoIIE family protein phosphatase n=1 Tax=Thermoactinospora rubra TaxID=1088767 RepID=UPI000A105FA2|nr:SpoIIE family protein phosphatase [Thermoactinospora rubra]